MIVDSDKILDNAMKDLKISWYDGDFTNSTYLYLKKNNFDKKENKALMNLAKKYADRIKNKAPDLTNAEVLNNYSQAKNLIENITLWNYMEKIQTDYKSKYFIWLPTVSENPRHSHIAYYGHKYSIEKGADGKGLLPMQEYGCRCGMKIIENENEDELENDKQEQGDITYIPNNLTQEALNEHYRQENYENMSVVNTSKEWMVSGKEGKGGEKFIDLGIATRGRGAINTKGIEIMESKERTKGSEIREEREIPAFYGKKYENYKEQEVIEKLLEVKEGWIENAFYREETGGIDLVWGDERRGLRHIIGQRTKQKIDAIEFIKSISEVIKNGKITFNDKTKRFEILYKGKMVIIDNKNDKKFILTAYKTRKK